MRKNYKDFIFPALVLFISLGVFQLGAADFEKVLGEWDLEIDAGGEYYYLTMKISAAEGSLQGTISEANGYFFDVPLKDILLDGSVLSMKFTSPTPPDGLEREVVCSYEVGDDVLEGTIALEEVELIAPVVGTRGKK